MTVEENLGQESRSRILHLVSEKPPVGTSKLSQ